ncbi:MAG: homoserine O-succinyltransferase MetA [Steroidobacteraceae bacterium]
MPLAIEDRGDRHPRDGAIVIAVVNNMPDRALEATERQFASLLGAAAGHLEVRLRRVSLPQVPRGAQALEHIARGYFTLEELLAEPPDALIVTGMEPRAPRLEDEPYWQSMVRLLQWAEAHTASSIWSCLAAHAAVQALTGVRRRRLPRKCFGIFEHRTRAAHELLRGVGSPLLTPHSRWNELRIEDLENAELEVLSASEASGADLFVRARRSLLVCFQGHPEYEDSTLLKEYRRDVGRFLRGEQEAWPTLPEGYFGERGLEALARYRQDVEAARDPARLADFPTETLAAELHAPWRAAAVAIYRNWLAHIAAVSARPR